LPGIYKYFPKLPFDFYKEYFVSLGEGHTPLILWEGKLKAGIKMWIKNESLNPTGTYKDRPATIAVSKAKELYANGVVVASDGNAAPAVAAYAAKGKLPCIVLMPQKTPELRYLQSKAYGAKIFLVDGSINDCLEMSKEIAKVTGYHNCCTSSSMNPYQIEGNKTIAFEIVEDIQNIPDWVAVPVGGGGLLSGIVKGFEELKKGKVINKIPKILAVQAKNCAPLVEAFLNNDVIRKIENVKETIALTIALPYPLDGTVALECIRRSNGIAVAVTEEEIIQATLNLSSELGILAEPSGAVSFAGLLNAVSRDIIQPGETCVAVVTGSGLKSIEIYNKAKGSVLKVSGNVKELMKYLN